MNIVDVHISDTLGTKEAHFKPKSLTLITGPNGAGKSSIMTAMRYIFEGGSSPEIIRKGTTKSVVSFTLDTGHVVTKTTAVKKTRGGELNGFRTELEILDPQGIPVPAPQTFVNSLSEALAVDPGAILRIDTSTTPGRKQLADLLLRIMPIEFSGEDISEALSVAYRDGAEVRIEDLGALALPPLPAPVLDLDGLKKYAGMVTEQRRRIGIVRDEASGGANELRKSLPEGVDDGRDLEAELTEAEEYRRTVEKTLSGCRLDLEQEKSKLLASAKDEWQTTVQENNAAIDAKIAALQAERNQLNNAARERLDAKKAAIEGDIQARSAALDEEAQPEITKASADVTRIREMQKAVTRVVTLRAEIERQGAKARDHAIKYDQLSEILQRLEKLRRDKLASLPVSGLEVSEGDVLVEGVSWRHINTARRVTIALQICCLKAGAGGFLFLDNSESLDQETRNAVERGVIEAGFQLFEARVSDQDGLTIETVDLHEVPA